MTRRDAVLAVVGLAAAMYCVHGLVTETGIVGWIYNVQQSLFGSSSLELTALIVIIGLMILGVGLRSLAGRFGGDDDDGAMERPLLGPGGSAKTDKPLSAQGLWQVALGMVVATWAIGLVAHAWLSAEQKEDAAARYEAITLADGAAAPHPAGKHVSLQGRLLGEHLLTHRKGSGSAGREEYHLLPMVSPGWSPGQPVSYIVRVKNLQELPGHKQRGVARRPGRPLPPANALLARLDGDVSVPVAQQFRKMGVVLAPGSHLVRVVPSRGGQPDVDDTSGEDFRIMLIICAGISGLFVLTFAAVHWGMVRQRRHTAAGRRHRLLA